jgi:pimeloyl-ACP methyl ester carboxylesterase
VIAQIGDTRLAYDDVGVGTPVAFLHAFPFDRTMWAPQTSALADSCRCLTIDTRGFGGSPAAPPFTMDQYADDVIAVLDAARVDRATIVGLSMGGYIAFALWRHAPQRLRALVLADTRAGADAPDTRQRRRELMGLAHSSGVDAVLERQLVGLLGKTTRDRRPDVESLVRTSASSATVDGILGALEAMLARPDSMPTLPTITVPTLVIVGEEDAITPPKEARSLQQAIPRSRIEVLAGAGHLSSVERPAAFNAVLSEFLHAIARPDQSR